MTGVAKVFVLCFEPREMYYKVGGIIGRVVPGGLRLPSGIRIAILYRKSMVLTGV